MMIVVSNTPILSFTVDLPVLWLTFKLCDTLQIL